MKSRGTILKRGDICHRGDKPSQDISMTECEGEFSVEGFCSSIFGTQWKQ